MFHILVLVQFLFVLGCLLRLAMTGVTSCSVDWSSGLAVSGSGNLSCWHIFTVFHPASTNQWIGLRENLQETIDFPMKYGAFL